MLFKRTVLAGIAAGEITLAFRRWRRPTVRPGGTLMTPVGLLAIDAVDPVDPADLSPADAAAAGYPSPDALRADLAAGADRTLYRIAFHRAGDDPRPALAAAPPDAQEMAALRTRLAAVDAASRGDPWTEAVLRRIGGRDGITAAEIARAVGMETAPLKARIRRLKGLGLTESLVRGYRLSPRGRALLDGS